MRLSLLSLLSMRLSCLFLLIGLSLFACQKTNSAKPTSAQIITHSEIDPKKEYPLEDVKASGLKLMALSDGFHLFPYRDQSSPLASHDELIILVHGYGSQGYEWIHALHEGSQIANVGFYKWDFHQCHEEASVLLSKMIESLKSKYQKIKIYAHSYGGIIGSLAAFKIQSMFQAPAVFSLNLIASPLAGHPKLKERCGFEGIKGKVPVGQHWTQWQTQLYLDSAFKDLPSDPQLVSIEGMQVVGLPAEYRGQRLGHNWSISYVIDQQVKQ
jgi:hypothetical protein